MQTVPLYDDRWLLRDGSRRRPRLLQWAEKNEFTRLADITFGGCGSLAEYVVFREESY